MDNQNQNPQSPLLVLLLFCFPLISFSFSFPTYSPHCTHIVPESSTPQSDSTTVPLPPRFLQLTNAYVQNADQILPQNPQFSADFIPKSFTQTLTPTILKLSATLWVKSIRNVNLGTGRRTRNRFRVYGGTRGTRSAVVRFRLSGFLDQGNGRICMVGSRFDEETDSGVVFMMNFGMNSTILSSLVTGTLRSLDHEGRKGYFRDIHVMGFGANMMNDDENGGVKGEIGDCAKAAGNGTRSLGQETGCMDVIKMSDGFELENGDLVDEHLGRFMSMNVIECNDKGTMRVMLRFSNVTRVSNGLLPGFDPSKVLVAEGAWNPDKSRVCFVGCRIIGFEDSVLNASIGDCSYRLSFVFPSVLSVRSRSVVNGRIWTNNSETEAGYFGRVGMRTSWLRQMGLGNIRYEYTEIERAGKYCTGKVVNDGKNYTNRYTTDMKFPVLVKNSKGQEASGHASPLYIGGQLWQDRLFGSTVVSTKTRRNLNVSYQISLNPAAEFMFGSRNFTKEEISIWSEGILDLQTGLLCMVGCQKTFNKSEPLDCQISISLQFPAPNSNKGDSIKGTIKSERSRSDPLHFERLELSATSLSKRQSHASVWRMDLEITMVLISSTLMCIFVVLQLFHVKKHPDALPFISIVMLVSLTLGHMIPLLLNFDAIVSKRSRQDIFFGNGTWLEVDEVLVRVITMVAFLLECRLLQLTWLSRGSDESRRSLWVSEKKVISWSFPLFIGGALIAWLLHPWRSSSYSGFLYRQIVSPWVDLKAFAGFILDCFLLPQIMFNIFSDSKEKALSPPYYLGTTLVRLMPHLYDLFRTHSSVLKLDLWYIYANPRMNYYSTGWDIVISCCGLLFAVVVFLQQRFGGRCILPRRLKERFAYEKVPVASSG